MKFCISALGAAVLFGACASPPDSMKVGPADFYDWIELRLEEYNAAVDQGSLGSQAVLSGRMKQQIDLRYDAIVERASSDDDANKRAIAVSALGFSQRPEAMAHLLPRLDDPVPGVRGSAAAAIGYLNPPQPPMEKLETLLQDSDVYVRHGALFAIKLLAKPERPPSKLAMERIIVLARDDADFGIRNEAVLVMGTVKDPSTILEPLARKCLVDESFLVRGNAALVLARFGYTARQAVPLLIDRLKDGETSVVEKAHYALKAITGRVDADRQWGSWMDWLKELSQVLEFVCEKDDIVSQSPGPCPKCGVQMEPRAIPEAEFVCPEHPEVVSLKSGKCIKCQKELLPRKKDSQK